MAKKSNQPKSRPGAAGGPASPWPKRILVAGVAAIVALLIAVVALSSAPLRGVPEGTETVVVGPPQHVEGNIHDDGEVPAGGAHDAAWLNCGVYDTPVRSENAVHSLEHGAVWITYRPDVGDDVVQRLRAFHSGDNKVIVSPVPGLEAPIIATAWANQLEVDDADDSRLEQFVNEFEGSLDAPEPGAACTGGVGVPAA